MTVRSEPNHAENQNIKKEIDFFRGWKLCSLVLRMAEPRGLLLDIDASAMADAMASSHTAGDRGNGERLKECSIAYLDDILVVSLKDFEAMDLRRSVTELLRKRITEITNWRNSTVSPTGMEYLGLYLMARAGMRPCSKDSRQQWLDQQSSCSSCAVTLDDAPGQKAGRCTEVKTTL